MANIETLFAKMTAPGQPRVSYGVYWALNKMKNCRTKSSVYNGVRTFVQWVSYKDAEFILPKLIGFDRFNGYREAIVYIGGDRVGVRYGSSGINGNIRVDVTWCDSAKMEKIAADEKAADEKKRLEEEKKNEIINDRVKVAVHLIRYRRSMGRDLTEDEERKEIVKVFGEDSIQLLEGI